MSSWKTSGSVLVLCAAMFATACGNSETAKRQSLENGKRLMSEGKTTEAIAEFRNALRKDARFGEARWELAQAYEKTDNLQNAFREYMRAADLLPDDSKVQLRAAQILLVTGRFEDARTRAENALKKDPKNVDALVLRASAMARQKNVDGAIKDIEDALKDQPESGQLYASLGALKVVTGAPGDAEAAFKKAVEMDPKSIPARVALAGFYWGASKRADAERVIAEARDINPADPLLNRLMAAYYISDRRFAEAEAPLKAAAVGKGNERGALILSDYYVQMNRPKDAIQVLQPLLSVKSVASAATLRLAQAERLSGDKDGARKRLDAFLKTEPKNADALTASSAWSLRDGNQQAALATAKQAVAANASSATAHFALAQAMVTNRQPTAEAIQELKEVVRLNPRVVTAHVLLARLQLEAGHADDAVQAAKDAKTLLPNFPEVRLVLVRALLAKGDIGGAETELRGLLPSGKDNPEVQAMQGILLASKRDMSGAKAAFEKALDKDPNSLDALNGLLALDMTAKNLTPAVARIEQRVSKQPNNPGLLFVAARTYAAAGQTDKTEKALRSVLQVDPDNLQAYASLGRLYASQNKLDAALSEIDTFLKRQPNHVGMQTMAGMILQLQNKNDEAQKRYEAVIAVNPRAAVAANNLAWLYAERGGNLDVALHLAQTATSQLQEAPEVLDTLGWVYLKKNLPSEAVPFFEKSVAKDAKNAGYSYHLGLAYARAGMKEKAREALERALQQNPQFDGADDARKTLADLRG
jgi:tetratricopeptide (TPR) repeat protein